MKIINKFTKEQKNKVENAIKELKLNQDEIDMILVSNLDKICELANVRRIDLMWYLRYER